jgi:predicted nuclease with RNAse H fold
MKASQPTTAVTVAEILKPIEAMKAYSAENANIIFAVGTQTLKSGRGLYSVRSDPMNVVGLDLAGVETRPTGFCLLTQMTAETRLLYTDTQILNTVQEYKPDIVAIDAPLTLPPGRKTIEERTSKHLRPCDEELLRRRIRFFPVTLGPMRKLTVRGIALKTALHALGLKVIEVYPGGAQDVMHIPRKQQGLKLLKRGLEKLGLNGLSEDLSDHELDAATCAYVGKLFLEGKACTYGTEDSAIIMPKA